MFLSRSQYTGSVVARGSAVWLRQIASFSTTQQHKQRDVNFGKEYMTPALGKLVTDSAISHGKGSWLYLEDGRKMLDFCTGIAVANTGHSHPRVAQAAKDQIDKIIHAQVNVAFSRPMIDLVDRLQKVVPPTLKSFFFVNSGSEAIENSIKIARTVTKRRNVICFQGSFHGRTMGALAMTMSKTAYRVGFSPMMEGVYVAPFPYCLHCFANKGGECCGNAIHQIELMLKQQTAPSDTAAIIVEPILGEGGYVVPPKGFLKALRQLCTKHGILMIVDEVQTGFGRTGKFFAIDHFLDHSEAPDMMVMAKGLASGFPLSAVASKKEYLDAMPPGSIGGTYAGNVVGCAAACATVDVIQQEGLLANAEARGEQLRAGLKRLAQKFPILDVRGMGLMNAVEFKPSKNGTPAGPSISRLCMENGLLLMGASVYDTLRFMPPLVITEQEIDTGLEIFTKALDKHFTTSS